MRFFKGKPLVFRKGGAQNRSVRIKIRRLFGRLVLLGEEVVICPDLQKVITAWDHLPKKIRQAILIMVGA